jgi:hypothetical protein
MMRERSDASAKNALKLEGRERGAAGQDFKQAGHGEHVLQTHHMQMRQGAGVFTHQLCRFFPHLPLPAQRARSVIAHINIHNLQ